MAGKCGIYGTYLCEGSLSDMSHKQIVALAERLENILLNKGDILCTIRVEDTINGGVHWSIHEAPKDEKLIRQSAWSYYPASHYLEAEIIPELHQRTDFYYGAIMYAHENKGSDRH